MLILFYRTVLFIYAKCIVIYSSFALCPKNIISIKADLNKEKKQAYLNYRFSQFQMRGVNMPPFRNINS